MGGQDMPTSNESVIPIKKDQYGDDDDEEGSRSARSDSSVFDLKTNKGKVFMEIES